MTLSRRTALKAAAATAALSVVERPLSARAASGDPAEQRPVVIVGSGYGAAVTAARLTQAGKNVLVLEMGQDWSTVRGLDGKRFSPTTPPDHRAQWFRTTTLLQFRSFANVPLSFPIAPYAGVLDAMQFSNLTVCVGRGVGGGSLVNGALVGEPDPGFLGGQLPMVDMGEFFARWIPVARTGLGVNAVAPDWFESSPYYQYARTARANWLKAGFTKWHLLETTYDTGYLRREQAGTAPKSALAGEVLFGNNAGKLDLTKTYLARARATGRLEIRPLTEVTSVGVTPEGRYTLQWRRIDPWGLPMASGTIVTPTLILGAGSIGTSKLLVKARAEGTLPRLDDSVGSMWAGNGNIMFTRDSGAKNPVGGQQSTIPVFGLDNRDDPLAPVHLEAAPVPVGFETHILGYLANTQTDDRARVVWRNGRLDLTWTPAQSEPMIAQAKRIGDRLNAVEGTNYRTDVFGSFTGKAFSDGVSHPLGGVPMGRATDDYGRVKNYPGLYVNDGSLIPGATSVNPMLTIAALAERNIATTIGDID